MNAPLRPAGIGYGVTFDLSGLLGAQGALAQQIFPLITQAVAATAEQGAFQWKDEVWKAPLWSVEKQAYIDSIKWEMKGPYEAVITADYDKANEIESGRPARDLKRMLQTSKKTRMAMHGKHAGQKYLIIPFRHNTPGGSGEGAYAPQMPKEIYAKAKALSPSFMLPPGSVKPATRLSASGHTVAQHSYSWGGRLPEGLAPKLADHHATDPYSGMVRMRTKKGPFAKHAYMTFRVMGEWSPGWVVAAKPGLNLAHRVSQGLQANLESNVGKAMTLAMLRR